MEKIKRIITYSIKSDKGKDILVIIIVVIVGLVSFMLGRLSKNDKSPKINEYQEVNDTESISSTNPEINISQDSPNSTKKVSVQNNVIPNGKNFFASSRGSKYYTLTCSGGKTIKQENRVYFSTEQEAQNAGYTRSSSCK